MLGSGNSTRWLADLWPVTETSYCFEISGHLVFFLLITEFRTKKMIFFITNIFMNITFEDRIYITNILDQTFSVLHALIK